MSFFGVVEEEDVVLALAKECGNHIKIDSVGKFHFAESLPNESITSSSSRSRRRSRRRSSSGIVKSG